MMRRAVGIDIGNYSIKLIELEDKKGCIELTKCAVNPIAGGDITSALKGLLSRVKLSLKRVNVSLSGPSVIVRYIEMPPMKKDELKNAIKFEAEKYIPFDIKNSIIDCAMLDRTSSNVQRVLLVAAKKDEVNKLLEVFKKVSLEINAIDVDSFAFLNAFERLDISSKEKGATYALINIGTKFSNMNIVTEGNVYFTRDILWGDRNIAERIKGAAGIDSAKEEEIPKLIAPFLEKLISQIRMSFDYFESQFGRNVGRLYVSGGSSYLFNIVDFLKENLGIDTIMWNPFDGIVVNESIKEIKESPGMFAVAVGLALRK